MAEILDTGGNLHTLTEFTASDISAVRYDTNAQGLTSTQKGNARTNIGALGSNENANGISCTLTTTGIEITSDRIKNISGGYCEIGDLVYVNIKFTAKTDVAYNNFGIMYGLPNNSMETALSCSLIDASSSGRNYIVANARAIGSGGTANISIQAVNHTATGSNYGIRTNEQYVITGFYKKA